MVIMDADATYRELNDAVVEEVDFGLNIYGARRKGNQGSQRELWMWENQKMSLLWVGNVSGQAVSHLTWNSIGGLKEIDRKF